MFNSPSSRGSAFLVAVFLASWSVSRGEDLYDDFEDGDVFDCDPVCWETFPLLPGSVQVVDGSLRLQNSNPNSIVALGAGSQEGDITLHTQVHFEGAGFCGLIAHGIPPCAGYLAFLTEEGELTLQRYDSCLSPAKSITHRLEGFFPDEDYLLQLDVRGDQVELRAWPADGERPAEPQLVLDDSMYRSGKAGLQYQNMPLGTVNPQAWGEFRFFSAASLAPCGTHCQGLEVREIQESGNNVRVTAQASDEGGDPILYTFKARRGFFLRTIGPQSGPSADFDLPPGEYAITVSVGDGSTCSPETDSVCTRSYVVAGLQRPGDCNQDGELDISDAVCVLGYLFLGAPERLPCGNGSSTGAGNVSLADWQPDGSVDLSDGIGLLQFLFNGERPHALGSECTAMVDCPEICKR